VDISQPNQVNRSNYKDANAGPKNIRHRLRRKKAERPQQSEANRTEPRLFLPEQPGRMNARNERCELATDAM
jgi:hypothetical protein